MTTSAVALERAEVGRVWEDDEHLSALWDVPTDPRGQGNLPDEHRVFAPTSRDYADNERFRARFSEFVSPCGPGTGCSTPGMTR